MFIIYAVIHTFSARLIFLVIPFGETKLLSFS
jgi:hypothetical protein